MDLHSLAREIGLVFSLVEILIEGYMFNENDRDALKARLYNVRLRLRFVRAYYRGGVDAVERVAEPLIEEILAEDDGGISTPLPKTRW